MEAINPSLQSYTNPNVAPISDEITEAIEQSPLAPSQFLQIEEADKLVKPGYMAIENGYALQADGSYTVSVLTDMPDVTPAMWHWWFGWHGDSSEKYKLWHPPAHVSAVWEDGKVGEVAYIGRNSHIQEYIGPPKESASIQFKSPTLLGLPEFDPVSSNAVYIVARIGLRPIPINFGWLIHQVRTTATGSEMRSRFWLGGEHIAGRNRFSQLLVPIVRRVRKIPEAQVIDLTTHCAEEMAHLATFLPDIYQELGAQG
ncbi:MAG: hypothetical protein AAF614_32130 [Chloroflexota bacterium]